MLLATVVQLIRHIGDITRNQIARRLSAAVLHPAQAMAHQDPNAPTVSSALLASKSRVSNDWPIATLSSARSWSAYSPSRGGHAAPRLNCHSKRSKKNAAA
jgi:hypothetical protein